ncbi:MAG: cysteine hydrolase [Rhodospirillales bacterium]
MIRWNGMDICETLDELVDPAHAGLLMWDFAQRIVERSFNADSMIANTQRLLAAARRNKVRTFYALQNNMYLVGDTGAPTVRLRMKRQNKPVAAIAEVKPPVGPAPRDAYVEAVKPQDGDVFFEKFSPNAFLGTAFEWWLKKFGIKTVILTGINVATGISGTAREATNLGYYAVVVRDCVGTPSKPDYDVAIDSLERLFDVVDADDIIASWDKAKR